MELSKETMEQVKKGITKAGNLVSDGINTVNQKLGFSSVSKEKQLDAARIATELMILYGAVRLLKKAPFANNGFVNKYLTKGISKIVAGVEFCLGVTIAAELVTSLASLVQDLLNKDKTPAEAEKIFEETINEDFKAEKADEATEEQVEAETVEFDACDVIDTAEEAEEPAAIEPETPVVEEPIEKAVEEKAEAVPAYVPVETSPVEIESEDGDDESGDEEGDDLSSFAGFAGLSFIDAMADPEKYAEMCAREAKGEVKLVTRYRMGYECRLAQSAETVQDYYNEIKNCFLKYKGVKARTSWSNETFNNGRTKLAKINVKNKTLYLYLAIDPSTLDETKYNVTDMSGKKKYEMVPALLKVKGDRKFHYAIELIDLLCGENLAYPGVKNFTPADYKIPAQTTEEMVANGLIKKLVAEVPVNE